MNVLKLIVEKLEKKGLFEPFKIKKQEEKIEEIKEEEEESKQKKKLDVHPFAGYNSKMVSLVCSLTYR